MFSFSTSTNFCSVIIKLIIFPINFSSLNKQRKLMIKRNFKIDLCFVMNIHNLLMQRKKRNNKLIMKDPFTSLSFSFSYTLAYQIAFIIKTFETSNIKIVQIALHSQYSTFSSSSHGLFIFNFVYEKFVTKNFAACLYIQFQRLFMTYFLSFVFNVVATSSAVLCGPLAACERARVFFTHISCIL